MLKIFIIRHGETAWNREQIFRGRADIPLSETGLAQAKLAADRMGREKLAAVYTSPLQRSRKVAGEVAETCGLTPVDHEGFIDFSFGEWEGLPAGEVKKRFPDAFRAWSTDPASAEIPGGEKLALVAKRAMDALREVAKRHEGDDAIAVVTHRVIIKVLVLGALETALTYFRNVRSDTTSISRLDWDTERFHLAKLNDTCHLAPLRRADEADF